MTFQKRLWGVIRLVLGSVFVISGVVKSLDPYSFAEAIKAYRLVPESAIFPIAYVLPMPELILGLCVMLNLFIRFSVPSIAILLVLFQAALASVLIRRLDSGCGCFGSLSPANRRLDIIIALARNLVLLALATAVLVTKRKPALTTH